MFTNVHDYSLSVVNLFHIELLSASTQVNLEFKNAMHDFSDEIADALGIDLDEWQIEDKSSSEIQISLLDMNLSGFLISFKTALPHQFSFTSDGQIQSYSESNSFITEFFHGNTVEECLVKAVLWRKEIVSNEAENEKE
ncbi:hypothetical protein OTK49_01540 [Vibrio coralliirubri]|uniref:hypothetical protein n=1 Tax=Vibrio coralliirubri TaxID=1516159 RepID=UPI00228361D5|nr:hypothetical protein [Vibrio coralliirubri]MCY9861208.1 hypothetical protein [Vibrio coralliirubri]